MNIAGPRRRRGGGRRGYLLTPRPAGRGVEKSEILAEFSSSPDKYYRVDLFEDEGFTRASCSKCGRFFWSSAPRAECPDHDRASAYSFIGDPPTARRLDYATAWSEIESFFSSNGHTPVQRYPVVCRWRDDLHFTIASIVDFQRVMGSKVVFEFPANPLVVPQTCLRFKDLENVGVTGRHFSSFCMVGQHAVPDEPGGYWKDECVRLDHAMLTGPFGIGGDEIVYVEDVWEGGGSFGPSLEYFVGGLELGNAVFTEFQGRLGEHERLDRRVIDMGAGLERLSWITMGTPTAYDCCFGPAAARAAEALGAGADSEEARAYFAAVARMADEYGGGEGGGLRRARAEAARAAGLSEADVRRSIAPLEAAYLVADHVRTLVFAIADGALPSNVGGGYNLRMMLRRIVDTAGRFGQGGLGGGMPGLDEMVDLHVGYLSRTYPELAAAGGDVKRILAIEVERYGQSRRRIEKIAARLGGSAGGDAGPWGGPGAEGAPDGGGGGGARQPSVSELITLYESDGVTPDYLLEAGVISEVPPAFYSRLAELRGPGRRGAHGTGAGEGAPDGAPVGSLAATEALFYGEDPMEFGAAVLWAGGSSVVLDRTSFYARGGGQEPDHGTIGGLRVTDVAKHGGVIVHTVEGDAGALAGREGVRCSVDAARRAAITRNHTGTHILNASARSVLGSWVWQHSAFKDADHARLDVTHHSPLTAEQVGLIQDRANAIIGEDHPVTIRSMARGPAEREYGFRIYQGGVVPVSSVRIVSIGGIDSEACGGTHVGRTGQVGALRITRAKRIQDGVVRLEFSTGAGAGGGGGKGGAEEEEEEEERRRRAEADAEAARAERDRARAAARQADRQRVPGMLEAAMAVQDGGSADLGGLEVRLAGGRRACVGTGGGLGEAFHIEFGRRLVEADRGASYCGVFLEGPTVRIVAYAGPESGRDAAAIVRAAAAAGGGSGGGKASFAQGGCKDASRAEAVAGAAAGELFP